MSLVPTDISLGAILDVSAVVGHPCFD